MTPLTATVVVGAGRLVVVDAGWVVIDGAGVVVGSAAPEHAAPTTAAHVRAARREVRARTSPDRNDAPELCPIRGSLAVRWPGRLLLSVLTIVGRPAVSPIILRFTRGLRRR
ncbi:MAG TPA: hypothetical protein VGC47_04320 [Acidimicrobiia bacterium]